MTRQEYLTAIKSELNADPTSAGLSSMSDEQVAEWFGASLFQGIVLLPFAAIKRWAAANGVRKKIRDSATLHASSVVQSVCITLEDSMGLLDGSLDLRVGTPDRSMCDALVSGGVMTEGERDSLLATATTAVSRAYLLGITPPNPSDIADARRLA